MQLSLGRQFTPLSIWRLISELAWYSRKPAGLRKIPDRTELVTVAALGVSNFCKSCMSIVSGTTVLN